MIRIVCNHCGAKLQAPDDATGKTLRCPKCEGWVLVESPTIADPPPPTPASTPSVAYTAPLPPSPLVTTLKAESSPQFDPLHQWLGIPPTDQPPNHYRLLSLQPFEDDPGVIEHAADRQMSHIRKFQQGEHQDLSQKLLNEIARARVCLLSPSHRAKYDKWLREQIAYASFLAAQQPSSMPRPSKEAPAGFMISAPPPVPRVTKLDHGVRDRTVGIVTERKWGRAMIRVACSHCGAELEAPDDAVGKTVRCPKCEDWVLVESPAITPPPIPEKQESSTVSLDDIPEANVEWDDDIPEAVVDWGEEEVPTRTSRPAIQRQHVGGVGSLIAETIQKDPKAVYQLVAGSVGAILFLCMFFWCSGIMMNAKPNGSTGSNVPPARERTLDEIFAIPKEERTFEEQRRAEEWAKADAQLRYGVDPDDFE